jgi:hypothetical protein
MTLHPIDKSFTPTNINNAMTKPTTIIPSYEAVADGEYQVHHSELPFIISKEDGQVDVQYVAVLRDKYNGEISFQRYSRLQTLKVCVNLTYTDVHLEKTVSYISSVGSTVWSESFPIDPVTFETKPYSHFKLASSVVFKADGTPSNLEAQSK